MKPTEFAKKHSELLMEAAKTVPVELIIGMSHLQLTDLATVHLMQMRMAQAQQSTQEVARKIINPNAN